MVHLGTLDQAVKVGDELYALHAATEQPVLPAHGEGPDCISRQAVVDLDDPIV
jgi:hypothetical protein